MWQCAIPVFDSLLPSQHNKVVMTLLYRLAEWHALAKLRMHTDTTLSLMDLVTTALGQQLRQFRRDVCSAYATKNLPKEEAARKRKKRRNQAKDKSAPNADGSSLEATRSSPKSNKSGNIFVNLNGWQLIIWSKPKDGSSAWGLIKSIHSEITGGRFEPPVQQILTLRER
jgi:hypothetical protein